MLQAPELALDGGTSPIEALPAQRLPRDERVKAVGFDLDRRGLALACWAAPLASGALAVSASEPPLADSLYARGSGRFRVCGEVDPCDGERGRAAIAFLHKRGAVGTAFWGMRIAVQPVREVQPRIGG
jgi:hypothetical protein